MEDNKQTQTQEQQMPKGWKDVMVGLDAPITALLQLVNVLNQRVCQLEDIVKTNYNGETMTVTEYIRIRTEEEQKKFMEEQAKAQAQENKAE